MYKVTLWYSVRNGGDGSAYPHFFESEELAKLDQKLQEEWGESCTGSITLSSESPILCNKNITTKDDFIKELKEDLEYVKISSYSKYRIPILEEVIKKLEMSNLINKYWLGVFNANWADEMDVSGFRLFTDKDKKDFEDSFKKVEDEINFGIGSNESIEFTNGEDLLSNINWIELLLEEYIFIDKIFDKEFGFFPNIRLSKY